MTNAIVLAAGRGSRLGKLTDDLPKPLLRVGGRPILFRLLATLHHAGIEDVVLVVGYLGDQIRQRIGDGRAFGLRARYVTQDQIGFAEHALALGLQAITAKHVYCFCADDLVEDDHVEMLRPTVGEDAVFLARPVLDSVLPRVEVDESGAICGTSNTGMILTYNFWASSDLLRRWLALCLGPPTVALVYRIRDILPHARLRAVNASSMLGVNTVEQLRYAENILCLPGTVTNARSRAARVV